MDMVLYWVKDQTRQGHFLIYWDPGKTNRADYFDKHNPPSHYTEMRRKYPHKNIHSLIFVPMRGCINHGLVITSPDMSHEPRGPKYYRQ